VHPDQDGDHRREHLDGHPPPVADPDHEVADDERAGGQAREHDDVGGAERDHPGHVGLGPEEVADGPRRCAAGDEQPAAAESPSAPARIRAVR